MTARIIGFAAFALCCAPAHATAAQPDGRADWLLRGGTVYPGAGEPFIGDVAIDGDRILAAAPALEAGGAQVIDATGLIVAPGFIDPHTHLSDQLASDQPDARLVAGFLMQGVTTAFIGNDGGGALDTGAVLARYRERPVGINYATYVGFGEVRRAVLGDAARAPDVAELAQMRALVAAAMCEGALGLSTGLFYAPQSFATTQEVADVAAAAGRRGGFYDTHLRDESSYSIGLLASVTEALAIGRQAQLPVHLAHIKALGVDVHGQAGAVIAFVEQAQAAGQQVTADQYPWSASGTSLAAALVPRWAMDGGRSAMLARFDDTAQRARLHSEMAENLRRRGGAASLLITEGPDAGRRLSEIAARAQTDAVTAALATIRRADVAVASFNQTEGDIRAFMARPWVMTGSDASAGHPRAYGSFARKYAEYVRTKPALSLREFIYRSSTLAARTFGLAGRGELIAGANADIVVFDPARFAARADYAAPTLLAAGVEAVFVNGALAVERGALTGRAAGRGLPRTPPAGTCP